MARRMTKELHGAMYGTWRSRGCPFLLAEMHDYIRLNSGSDQSLILDLYFLSFIQMVSLKDCVDGFSFVFFLISPLTSYGDQIYTVHRRKSSLGFSIDVCGIMLVARYSPLELEFKIKQSVSYFYNAML